MKELKYIKLQLKESVCNVGHPMVLFHSKTFANRTAFLNPNCSVVYTTIYNFWVAEEK